MRLCMCAVDSVTLMSCKDIKYLSINVCFRQTLSAINKQHRPGDMIRLISASTIACARRSTDIDYGQPVLDMDSAHRLVIAGC